MDITVVVIGNRDLAPSLFKGIDRKTRCRTVTGAARAIIKAEADAKVWRRTIGKWGSYTLEIGGEPISADDACTLYAKVDDALDDRESDPVKVIARAITDLAIQSWRAV